MLDLGRIGFIYASEAATQTMRSSDAIKEPTLGGSHALVW